MLIFNFSTSDTSLFREPKINIYSVLNMSKLSLFILRLISEVEEGFCRKCCTQKCKNIFFA